MSEKDEMDRIRDLMIEEQALDDIREQLECEQPDWERLADNPFFPREVTEHLNSKTFERSKKGGESRGKQQQEDLKDYVSAVQQEYDRLAPGGAPKGSKLFTVRKAMINISEPQDQDRITEDKVKKISRRIT